MQSRFLQSARKAKRTDGEPALEEHLGELLPEVPQLVDRFHGSRTIRPSPFT